MKALILGFLLFCTLLSACHYSSSSAFILWLCPSGEPRINLELAKATNQWVFSVHDPGWGNAVEYYHLLLPLIPAKRHTFSSSDLLLKSIRDQSTDLPSLTGGTLIVDLKRKEAIVSIETDKGPFQGNGTYPLSISPRDIPSTDSPLTLSDLRIRCQPAQQSNS